LPSEDNVTLVNGAAFLMAASYFLARK